MRRPWWFPVLLAALIVAAPGRSLSDADELDRNRRLLERWKADPEHYERLRRDLRAFHEMPPERQEAMRRLDSQLHREDPATQTRLWTVLTRYREWVDRLAPEDRRYVLTASEAERRRRIRALRDREWEARLPARLRDELKALPPQKKAERVKALRAEEQALKQTWLSKPGQKSPPRPRRTSELPAEVQRFVKEHLLARLSAEEKEQFRRAEGSWPDLPRTLLALAERHPVLPPLPSGPIVRYTDLPAAVKGRLGRVRMKRLEGKWPDFALAVARRLKTEGDYGTPLGACRPGDFPAPAREFIEKKLPGLLNEAQLQGLRKLEGRWPDYPQQLHRLARLKHLVIPGMSLPGPRDLWEAARAYLPDVPDRTLHRFALTELTAEQRRRMGISLADPAGSREKIKKAYYRANAGELKRQGFDVDALLQDAR